MAKKISANHQVNCRKGNVGGGWVEVWLPYRTSPVRLRESWCKFTKRNVKPEFKAGAEKYPLVLTMPMSLAIQSGVTG